MRRNIDLLNGNILTSLAGLAVPIMGTSLVQAAYNLTDMAWIGMVGSEAVTAVGAAGMYTWLSNGVVTLARMGGQVKTAQAYGEGNMDEAVQYGKGAVQLAIVLALSYGLLANLFAWPLIGFFHLSNAGTVAAAVTYLRITCGLLLFPYLVQTMTGLYTAVGNSRTPFLANCLGLVMNMVLDPMMILGLGPFPKMGVAGAATATVSAQIVVFLVMLVSARKDSILSHQIRIWQPTALRHLKNIVRIGFPAAVMDTLYCSISMILTRFVTRWEDSAVAIQRIGGQIESISWMTAQGFGTAINAFTAQNCGAGNYKRMKQGYTKAAWLMLAWGLLTTGVLIFGATPIFSIFIHEAAVIPAGASYMRIIGIGEMFMCIELMTVGAMSGLGRTMEASVITVLLTAMRVPLAFLLGNSPLGLDGVWWALTISSVIKGIVFFIYYQRIMRRWGRSDSVELRKNSL